MKTIPHSEFRFQSVDRSDTSNKLQNMQSTNHLSIDYKKKRKIRFELHKNDLCFTLVLT